MLVLSFDAQAALAEDPQKAAVRECQLSLDVPQTAAAAGALPGLAQRGAQAGRRSGGHRGRRLRRADHRARLRPIGKELEQLYAQLETLDLAAGSAAARRLFS